MELRPIALRWDERPLEKVSEMVSRKAVGGRDVSLTQVYCKKGTLVPHHLKATEQVVSVLQGALRLTIDTGEITVREGEAIVIPAGAARQVECLDDTFMLVVERR